MFLLYSVYIGPVSFQEYTVLDGATIVPGNLVVKPVFYSHCYADESDLDPERTEREDGGGWGWGPGQILQTV